MRALLVAACLGGLPASAAVAVTPVRDAPADGFIGIALTEAPVDRHDDLRARMYIVDHLAPGTTIHRALRVSNTTAEPQHIDVYAAAAAVDRNTFAFATDRAGNELTSWISLDRPAVDVPAYGETDVRATITVPDSASRGERYAVVWASVTSAPEPGAGVTQAHRVGVRIYLDIGPGGEPPSDFEIERVTAIRSPDGKPSITALVRNTGERALDLGGTLTLEDGPGSLRAGPYKIVSGVTLAPGNAGEITVPLDPKLPDGPWKAHLDLRSGFVERSLTASMTLPAPGKTADVAFKPAASLAPRLAVGGALALTAFGLVGLGLYARRTLIRLRPTERGDATDE